MSRRFFCKHTYIEVWYLRKQQHLCSIRTKIQVRKLDSKIQPNPSAQPADLGRKRHTAFNFVQHLNKDSLFVRFSRMFFWIFFPSFFFGPRRGAPQLQKNRLLKVFGLRIPPKKCGIFPLSLRLGSLRPRYFRGLGRRQLEKSQEFLIGITWEIQLVFWNLITGRPSVWVSEIRAKMSPKKQPRSSEFDFGGSWIRSSQTDDWPWRGVPVRWNLQLCGTRNWWDPMWPGTVFFLSRGLFYHGQVFFLLPNCYYFLSHRAVFSLSHGLSFSQRRTAFRLSHGLFFP